MLGQSLAIASVWLHGLCLWVAWHSAEAPGCVETAAGCYLFPQSLERCALNRSAHIWAWPPEHLRVHRMEERSLWNKCKLDCKQQHSCARDRLRPPAPERSPREKVLSNFQWLQTVPRVTEILITRSPCGKWGAWSIFTQISLTKVDIIGFKTKLKPGLAAHTCNLALGGWGRGSGIILRDTASSSPVWSNETLSPPQHTQKNQIKSLHWSHLAAFLFVGRSCLRPNVWSVWFLL